jgi:hypothetical protein
VVLTYRICADGPLSHNDTIYRIVKGRVYTAVDAETIRWVKGQQILEWEEAVDPGLHEMSASGTGQPPPIDLPSKVEDPDPVLDAVLADLDRAIGSDPVTVKPARRKPGPKPKKKG